MSDSWEDVSREKAGESGEIAEARHETRICGNLEAEGRIRGLKLYLEDDLRETVALLREGSQVAYVEVQFFARYYERYLARERLDASLHPMETLRALRGKTLHPHEVVGVLNDIGRCAYKGVAAELYFIGKSNELMAHILRMERESMFGDPMDRSGVEAVLSHIDANFCSDIRRDTLVDLARMSPTKLKNLFKRMTGKTITEYIVGKRMEKAAFLLSNTDAAIDEIATRTGYGTSTGFAASFRKQAGLSPTAYRKKMKFECIRNPSSLRDIIF